MQLLVNSIPAIVLKLDPTLVNKSNHNLNSIFAKFCPTAACVIL